MGRPIIGITTVIDGNMISLNENYIKAITDMGGVPMLLAKNDNDQSIKEQVEILDGVYLTGGSDINPQTYGEEPHPKLEKVEHGRDEYEIKVIREAFKHDIPILGVCRGSQLLNSLTSGTMYQDLEAQYEGNYLIQHRQESPRDYLQHGIVIEKDTLMHKLVGKKTMRVNSHHHQANKEVDTKDFIVSARSEDGVIEAIEGMHGTFVLGLQFHPEDAYTFDESNRKILNGFIKASKKYRDGKKNTDISDKTKKNDSNKKIAENKSTAKKQSKK